MKNSQRKFRYESRVLGDLAVNHIVPDCSDYIYDLPFWIMLRGLRDRF